MEVSLLLAEKITSMFLMCICGYAVVKLGLLKPRDSKILSIVLVYICSPCVSIYSFQIDCTADKLRGLLFAVVVVAVIHMFFIGFTRLIGRFFKLSSIERASIIYSNCGNLVIPLVTGVLGEQWLFYTSAYLLVQTFLIWTHGAVLVGKDGGADIRKILSNPNIAAIVIGFLLFAAHIRLPAVVTDCMGGFTDTIGPLAMVITGMLIGDADLKGIFTGKRAWLVCFCRLLLVPAAVAVLAAASGIASLHPDGKMILMVVMLAVSASVANTVTQQAQIFGNNPVYASSINVLSVVGCIATMPSMILLFETLV